MASLSGDRVYSELFDLMSRGKIKVDIEARYPLAIDDVTHETGQMLICGLAPLDPPLASPPMRASTLALATLLAGAPLPAQDDAPPSSASVEVFQREVRPLLAELCFRHSGESFSLTKEATWRRFLPSTNNSRS